MGASYGKQKNAKAGKLDIGRFTALPHAVIHSEQYRQLGYAARALLFDIAAQYNGKSNGSLVCCTKYLRPLGWNSNGTISRATKALVESGLLIQTRQGMMPPQSQAAWFALGWFGLDITEGLDIEPKYYRRCQLTPIKTLTPIKGAVRRYTAPAIGIATSNLAPIKGAVKHNNDQIPVPITGDLVYLPSNQRHSANAVAEARLIH